MSSPTREFEPRSSAAQELGSFYPRSWDELRLPPELKTPDDRFKAALNIFQNGAQTLTMFAMDPRPGYWLGYYRINQQLSELVGEELVVVKTTFGHLANTIGPVGAAARSTDNSRQWTKTEFGAALGPLLLFSWGNILALNYGDTKIDPMDVLGAKSQKIDNYGNPITTPAEVRGMILRDLSQHHTRRIADLTYIANPSPISHHTDILRETGLVTKKSGNTRYGDSVTVYALSEQGFDLPSWSAYVRKDGTVLPNQSEAVRNVFFTLFQAGRIATLNVLAEEYRSQTGRDISEATMSVIASYFAREGFVDQSEFHHMMFSEISLTPLGALVAQEIIEPIYQWSKNPRSNPSIVKIALQLQRDPEMDTFIPLLHQIADSFNARSPGKNVNPEAKKDTILGEIVKKPGELTVAEISRATGLQFGTAYALLQKLEVAGKVKKIMDGKRCVYLPVIEPK